MLFDVNRIRGPAYDISNLELIGSFSVDGNNKYLNDLSQLKYYKEPLNIENVDFNLNELKDAVVKSTEHNKLNSMLCWILENIDILRVRDFENSKRWLQPEFIFNRGTLAKILMTPYLHKDWIICASKFKGTIYMCNFYTDEQEMEVLNESEVAKRNTAWGFKFEQYMRSESLNADPDIFAPLNQNEEFHCIFKSEFGNKTLLYAAEIDAVSSQEIINDTLVGKRLELIELKTVFPRSSKDDKTKLSLPILRWWAQSYPVDIDNIVCGFKDAIGHVKSIIKYKLSDLDHFSMKNQQKRCKGFCNQFLDDIKLIVENDCDKSLYQFRYNWRNKTIAIKEMEPNKTSKYTLLYPWYIDKLKSHFENV